MPGFGGHQSLHGGTAAEPEKQVQPMHSQVPPVSPGGGYVSASADFTLDTWEADGAGGEAESEPRAAAPCTAIP